MKKILLVSMIVMACTFGAFAQKNDKKGALTPEKKEQIFNAKVKYFQESLLLTPEQTEKFISVYRKYADGVAALPRPQRTTKATTTDEAYKFIIAQLNNKKSVINLQENCIGELKSFLTAEQLLKFSRTENNLHNKIRNEQNCRKSKKNGPRAPRTTNNAR